MSKFSLNMKNKEDDKFKRAKHRVLKLRNFYKHLVFFIVFNGSLLLFKDKIAFGIFGEVALGNPKIMEWVYWNVLIWGIMLTIHAIIVFVNTSFLLKKWEERQLERFIKEGEEKKYE